jgi:hypothetical protein
MAVVSKARHHVPMHVGRDVAQAREVHLVGLHRFAHRRLHREHHRHQGLALLERELSHLARVALEDHAHEAGIVRLINAHHPAQVVLPEHRASRALAELAGAAQKGTLVNAFVPETPSMV